jgi:hypothetical protein
VRRVWKLWHANEREKSEERGEVLSDFKEELAGDVGERMHWNGISGC